MEGELVERIKVGAIKWECGRFHDDGAVAVHLDETFATVGSLLGFNHLGQAEQFGFVGLEIFPGREDDTIFEVCGGGSLCAEEDGGTSNASEMRIAGAETFNDLASRKLAHAIDEQVGFGLGHDGGAEFIFPVVVVSDTAHAGFHTSEHDRNAWESLSAHLGIDDGRVVGTFAWDTTGAVDILLTLMSCGGVVGEHGVEITRSDPDEELWGAHDLNGLDCGPIGLSDDADAQAFGFEHPADHGGPEGGVVDVGITRDDEHVELGPASGFHIEAGHGEEPGWLYMRGHGRFTRHRSATVLDELRLCK